MRCRVRLILILLFAAGAAASGAATTSRKATDREPPATAEQEAALLSAAGKGFHIQRTTHFLIAYDVAPSEVKPFVARVEQVYQSIYGFCAAHKIATIEPHRKLEIIYFDTFPEYERHASRVEFDAAGTYGFYSDADNRAVFYNCANDRQLAVLHRDLREAQRHATRLEKQIAQTPAAGGRITIEYGDGTSRTMTRDQARREFAKAIERLKKLGARTDSYVETINRTVVQHETAHQVFFNAGVLVRGGQNPAWLVEGLAMLFETPPTGMRSGIGVVNSLRLRDFRATVGVGDSGQGNSPDVVLTAMAKGRIAPLRELLTDRALFETRGRDAAVCYAEAWALVHYLHRTRTKEFAEYLRRISARPPDRPVSKPQEIAEFEEVFGKADDAFVRRWARYILSLPVPSP